MVFLEIDIQLIVGDTVRLHLPLITAVTQTLVGNGRIHRILEIKGFFLSRTLDGHAFRRNGNPGGNGRLVHFETCRHRIGCVPGILVPDRYGRVTVRARRISVAPKRQLPVRAGRKRTSGRQSRRSQIGQIDRLLHVHIGDLQSLGASIRIDRDTGRCYRDRIIGRRGRLSKRKSTENFIGHILGIPVINRYGTRYRSITRVRLKDDRKLFMTIAGYRADLGRCGGIADKIHTHQRIGRNGVIYRAGIGSPFERNGNRARTD